MWRKQSEFQEAHGSGDDRDASAAEPTSPKHVGPHAPPAASAPAPVAAPSADAAPAADAPAPEPGDASPAALRERIIDELRTIFDPEIPVNIYELGLIYEVAVDDDGLAKIQMTLTTPMCPAAEELPPEVETKARGVAGVQKVELDLVWDPPWNPDMMTEAARLELGMV